MPKPCLKLSCGTNFQGMTMWHDLQMTPGLRHKWPVDYRLDMPKRPRWQYLHTSSYFKKRKWVCTCKYVDAHTCDLHVWRPEVYIECPSASFKDLFIFVCKFECLYACTHTITCMSGAYRDKKRASDHLELQLQGVESCLFVGNGNSIQVLRKSTKCS